MATPVDIGLVGLFGTIWPFLLVTTIVFAFLTKMKLFGEERGVAISALIAVIMGVFTLFSPITIKTINVMAPWFVLVFAFAIFVIMTYMAFGVKEKDIVDTIIGPEYGATFGFWVLAVVLIIGLGSLSAVISEEKGFQQLDAEGKPIEADVTSEQAGFFAVILHPKVLGFALLMLIAFFTAQRLVMKGA